MRCSRRRALRLLGCTGALAATAGCSGPGSLDQLSLVASELDLSSPSALRRRGYLRTDPTEIPAVTEVDFTEATKSQYLAELFATGTVTVQQWPLVRRVQWGTGTAPRPTFLERDDRLYRVSIADQRYVTRERWHFAVVRTEETPPSDAVVAETPVDLSPQDSRVLAAALSAVYAGGDGFLGEPDFDELQTVEYHQGLDAAASELVPDPPFDVVKRRDTEQYYRPVTERRTVRVPTWTYAIEELTADPAEFISRARAEIVTHDLPSDLSDAAQRVVADAISDDDPRRYGESAPPSDALTEVLGHLGIADDLEPIDSYADRVDFDQVAATYGNATYAFSLLVKP